MIQDSINQMIGSAAMATNLYKYHANQKEAKLNANIASTKKSLEDNANAAKQLDDQIAFAEKEQQGLDTSTPEGANKWKEMEALKVQSRMSQTDQAKSTKDLEANLTKLSGYKGGIPKNAGQTMARTVGIDNVTANNKLYMAQKMRQYSLESAKAAVEAKEEQANNNHITIMGQRIDASDPQYAALIAKIRQYDKGENK